MFVIQATVKYHFEKEATIRFAGRGIGNGYSTGYPCWCSNRNDTGIKLFNTEDEAISWFNEEKQWLTCNDIEISEPTLMEITYIPIRKLSI